MTYRARLQSLTAREKQEDVLSEALNVACHIYDADFLDRGELHEASTGEEPVDAVHFVLCDPH